MGRTRLRPSDSVRRALGQRGHDDQVSGSFDAFTAVQNAVLPDDLIRYLTLEPRTEAEPPRKRQKLMSEQVLSSIDPPMPFCSATVGGQDIKDLTVKRSTLEYRFGSSKLSTFETPTKAKLIVPRVFRPLPLSSPYIDILDDSKCRVLRAHLPPADAYPDLHLALLVDLETSKWAKHQGRLWMELSAALFQEGGKDVLQLVFAIKWTTTISPDYIIQSSSQSEALSQVLKTCFPDSRVSQEVEKWSPQDFYRSVHGADKNDDVAASMVVDGVEAALYPFQKRAVQWLLRKEGVEWSSGGILLRAPSSNDKNSFGSFMKVSDALGQECYVSQVLGLITLDPSPFLVLERQLKGGILAEEMGLGKTVEIISLITLHKRPEEASSCLHDAYTAQDVQATGATLIVTPQPIVRQWISELNKHAPNLKVIHYQGIKHKGTKKSFSELIDDLARSDVVVTTYAVLAAEINFTKLNPEKQLRQESKHPRPKSPLMLLSWWRCVIDEAQMIESGVSKAAVVARMVPRVNAWCVTGTPVRKDVSDLLGLLVFLRYEPYASIKHTWNTLTSSNKHEFRRLFGLLALRHNKKDVREEINLPLQRRYIITMSFTPIEEQHYQGLFNEMCEGCDLDTQGAPVIPDWDPTSYTDLMRRWLVRLRQTALHPEIGGRNRRALGHKDGPLRTVDQVLESMMELSDASIRTDQRTLLTSKLKRGQLFENSPNIREALAIWTEATEEATAIVQECRENICDEIEAGKAIGEDLKKRSRYVSTVDFDSEEEAEPESSPLGLLKNRLRASLEIEHMAIFFLANAHFQIKDNKEMTVPDSPEFVALEKLEADGYEQAKCLRREILQENHHKAENLMNEIAKRAAAQDFVTIPELPSNTANGGLESRRILEQLDFLSAALDAQANVLDEWREQTIKFLTLPLVDEEKDEDITGEEYEQSTKTQDEATVYIGALRAVIADRHGALVGQESDLIKHDVQVALRCAKKGEGAAPEKTIELYQIRKHLKPTEAMGSLRGIVAEFRTLAFALRYNAENGNTRAGSELSIVECQLKLTQKHLSQQMKATTALEKEIELFSKTMNSRLNFYRQLQAISDMVAPFEGAPLEGVHHERVHRKMMLDEDKLSRKIAAAKARRRFLEHLKMEATNPKEARACIICRDEIEIGALTVCGHQYCKECILHWWSAHRNCPICKRKLIAADIHEITYKPQELSIRQEIHGALPDSPRTMGRKGSIIYSEVNKKTLDEIKNIELPGTSFTTKVDTLARHILYLRESDPGAKSVIFSQFKEFLEVLANAFTRYRIGFTAFDGRNGVEKFKEDPGTECFLLHARSQSSGLNLVNANHVFLCEPLLNTALELQAIARVDRIGQHQVTNVWLYLVDGTVEESIHQLSLKRRMEHIDERLARGKGKAKEIPPDNLQEDNLEEANSMELQRASLKGLLAKGGNAGEMVSKDDLWACLFGGTGQRNSGRLIGNVRLRDEPEMGRHLRAEAAEERASDAGSS